jgi:DNA-binding transcriptional ArsR family regulator
MSIEASRHVWATTKQSGSALIVLLAIADYADKSGLAWPTVKSLAAKARMSIRNVQYHLNRLRDAGEIVVMEGDNHWSANRYQIAGLHRGGEDTCTGEVQPIASGGCNPLHPGGAEAFTHKNPPDINNQNQPSNQQPAAAEAAGGAAAFHTPAPFKTPLSEILKTPVMPAPEIGAHVIPESPTQHAAHTPSPLVPVVSPSPANEDCDDDLQLFFNGSTAAEVQAMVNLYGRERIMDVINEVRRDPSAKVAPALVIHKLRSGARAAWQWPKTRAVETSNYSGGKYAAFIQD